MENELKFKEGDRVEIMINRPFDNETISIGDIGTVVKGFGGGFWMIRFDKEIHGHGENNNEWNISEKEVEKLNTERTSSKYKIFGKPIKRVEDILQVNYAKKKNQLITIGYSDVVKDLCCDCSVFAFSNNITIGVSGIHYCKHIKKYLERMLEFKKIKKITKYKKEPIICKDSKKVLSEIFDIDNSICDIYGSVISDLDILLKIN